MNGGSGLDLDRPREVGALLGDGLSTFARNLATFLAIAAAIVVPVELVVSGIGLEQITAPYDDSTSAAETVIPTILTFFVTTPLLMASTIHALIPISRGERPHAGRALQGGFDAFAPLLLAILIAAVGIALGLLALILPGIYLLVRWYFVPQAVVVEGLRGVDALRRSSELVQGSWWRTFGIVVLLNVLAAIPGVLILAPLEAVAEAADRELVSLAGSIAAETLTMPFVALVSTLLFYDLRVRRQALPV